MSQQVFHIKSSQLERCICEPFRCYLKKDKTYKRFLKDNAAKGVREGGNDGSKRLPTAFMLSEIGWGGGAFEKKVFSSISAASQTG